MSKYSDALSAFVMANNRIVQAWKNLDALLPEATDREAEAVQDMRASIKASHDALAAMVLAALDDLRNGGAEPK